MCLTDCIGYWKIYSDALTPLLPPWRRWCRSRGFEFEWIQLPWDHCRSRKASHCRLPLCLCGRRQIQQSWIAQKSTSLETCMWFTLWKTTLQGFHISAVAPLGGVSAVWSSDELARNSRLLLSIIPPLSGQYGRGLLSWPLSVSQVRKKKEQVHNCLKSGIGGNNLGGEVDWRGKGLSGNRYTLGE